MTRYPTTPKELFEDLGDRRCDQIVIGDVSFVDLGLLTINVNRSVTIASSTLGTVFDRIAVTGAGSVELKGIIAEKLLVESGSTVNLVDCDIQTVEVGGNIGLSGSVITNLDISGTAHVVEAVLGGFTCIRSTGRASFIRTELTAESLITTTGSSVQFTNCQINRAVDKDSLIGLIQSKLPKYLVPRVELPPAKYVGCHMNFRIKR